MGMSPSAELFYGFCLTEEETTEELREEEWCTNALYDDFEPENPRPDGEPGNYFHLDYRSDEYKELRAKNRQWYDENCEAIQAHDEEKREHYRKKTFGCSTGWYGVDGWSPMTVYIDKSMIRADWESSKISDGSLTVWSGWDEQLKQFCELIGIEYQEPGWCLTASYG